MQELLDACVQLDELAAELYELFSQSTTDPELKSVFERLQAEEAEHLAWWSELQRRLDAGEIEPLDPGSHVVAYMRAIVTTLRSMLGAWPSNLSDDDRLALAASLEFFTLDPVFSLLIRESAVDGGRARERAYSGHVDLLISAMEARESWPLEPHIALLRAATSDALTGEGLGRSATTGLPGRAVAERAIDDLCADAARAGEPISLALIDVPLSGFDPLVATDVFNRTASMLNSLLRFTDLLTAAGASRFAVVFPSTSNATACAATAVLADAASGVATEAGCGSVSAVSAVVTISPGEHRCGSLEAFEAAEKLLANVRAAGEPQGALELA